MRRREFTALFLVAAACGAGCNSGSTASDCSGSAVELAAGSACGYLITETGFLCPADLPEEYRFGAVVVCAEDGAALGPADEQALCEALAGEGYSWSADTGCTGPGGESVGLERVVDPAADTSADVPFDDSGRDVGTDAEPTDAEVEVSVPDIGVDGGPAEVGVDAGVELVACSWDEPCEDGFVCIQTFPVGCTAGPWEGQCEELPRPEESCPAVEVCGCDGTAYGDPCQARRAGYGGPTFDCSSSCAPIADSCGGECFEMRAYPYSNGCIDRTAGPRVVGCTEADGGTDDTPCVRRLVDGALFEATSGSPFVASSGWTTCTEEEVALLAASTDCD
ncbi:MAG: hypothetical protein H6700_09840 [Myxococcales bacterium]|nr:hypothetical protein [Myxococcales bacterium]MCB9532055.1 hypothetical protein [Myxococcales bacterium]